MDSTRYLVNQVMLSVRRKVENALETPGDHAEVLKILDDTPDIFQGIETEPLQTSYIKSNFNYVEYVEVPLGTKLVRRKKGAKMIIQQKEECFIYIPILKSIEQMLSNSRIKSFILKAPSFCEKDIYYDICDGSLFRNDNYFKEHRTALSIILYHDELEVCNPLGSNAGVHKIDMFYYTLGNLTPKFRSKHCAVRLLAIANANLVKKYGIDKILSPIISDLKDLHDGVIMDFNNKEVEMFGKVLICTGDTLGQHLWGGFKEGVGVAFQKCRSCYCDFEKMQTNFDENLYTLRTKVQYEKDCSRIEEAPNDNVKKDLLITYGINCRSALCELPNFDVTKQLPQDIMHTLLEGTVQYEVRLVLLHFIQNGYFTLKELNGAITSHNYGYSETSDRPGPLRETVFYGDERYKLKLKASQARLFLRLLPFFLAPMVDTNDSHFLFLIELIQMVQLIYSPVIKLDTLQCLKQMISEHLVKFSELFPDKNILPKQHYLIHIPEMIKSIGPMIRASCFSFEAAHNYFKQLARKQNFKNLTLSLAKRHQFLDCVNFGDSKEDPSSHPLFGTERRYGVLRRVDDEKIKQFRKELDNFGLLPSITLRNVYKVSWIQLHGTKYCKAGNLAVDVTGDPPLPVFGCIKEIWMVSSFVYFEVSLYKTVCFEYNFQAYLVEIPSPSKDFICSYERLVDFNVFHEKFDENSNIYIPVKYDIDDIIEEHCKDCNPLHM